MPSPPGTHTPPIIVRAQSITGSTSGSASPATSYGSFMPLPTARELEARLLANATSLGAGHSAINGGSSKSRGKRRAWDWDKPARSLRPARSSASVLGGPRPGASVRETELYVDSDADLSSDEGAGDRDEEDGYASSHYQPSLHGPSHLREETKVVVDDDDDDVESDDVDQANPTRGLLEPNQHSHSQRRRRRRSRIDRNSALVSTSEEDKQWGVKKMELMGRYWGRKGLAMTLGGVYLISTITSLEANTTPTIEPYFLSLLNSHSLLGAIVIVTNIAYAVGKPPFSKLVDVFGRAEGVFLGAALYSVGFLLTSTATDVRVFVAARAIAALGGQGLQLAQQIIVADTTTLTNRGLITSTISLPWLFTTWLGPPLGSWFESHGERGYRLAYLVFGLVLPSVAAVLGCTLLLEWHKAKRRLQRFSEALMSEDGRRRSRSSSPSAKEGYNLRRVSLGSKARALWRELDVLGLAALTIGCAFVLLPLALATKRPESWGDVETWLMIAAGGTCLAFFGWYEFKVSKVPLIPPRVLKNRTIMAGSALGFFHFISQFCYESFFTSFLQSVIFYLANVEIPRSLSAIHRVARHHSPRDASFISQSYIFSASITAIIAGIAAKWTKRYKWIGIAGVFLHAAGVWLMMRARNLNSSTFELVVSQLLAGAGGGWTTIGAQIGSQSVVSHQDVGIATATFLTITQVGGAVGGCIASAVWSTILPRRLRENLPAEQHKLIPGFMGSLKVILEYAEDDPIRIAIDRAYVSVQKVLNLLAIVMVLPALVAVLMMHNTHLDEEDQGQGEGVVVLGRASVMDPDVGSETSSLLGDQNGQV